MVVKHSLYGQWLKNGILGVDDMEVGGENLINWSMLYTLAIH